MCILLNAPGTHHGHRSLCHMTMLHPLCVEPELRLVLRRNVSVIGAGLSFQDVIRPWIPLTVSSLSSHTLLSRPSIKTFLDHHDGRWS
jgi:hypothetical protein